MIRQAAQEQLNRLMVKTLDQVFIMRAKEGLNCSLFEAQALTDLVKEVYFPWLSNPEAIQSGQLALTAVSAEEPGHKPLKHCQMVPVILTLYAGEQDHQHRLAQAGKQGVTALRRQQIQRMAQEALDQGALLTAEDLAFRIFNCGLRTISRDLQALAEEGLIVPLRSQQKDAGRALTHRVQAVELYLKRYTFTQIEKRIYHSLSSIANYVTTFAIVVAHTQDGHALDEIAFLMQISPSLVQAYQELYAQYNTTEYQERLQEIVALVKTRGFHPAHLDELASEKKGGLQP
jgi:predicted ArsR family transcriptional regulator